MAIVLSINKTRGPPAVAFGTWMPFQRMLTLHVFGSLGTGCVWPQKSRVRFQESSNLKELHTVEECPAKDLRPDSMYDISLPSMPGSDLV